MFCWVIEEISRYFDLFLMGVAGILIVFVIVLILRSVVQQEIEKQIKHVYENFNEDIFQARELMLKINTKLNTAVSSIEKEDND